MISLLLQRNSTILLLLIAATLASGWLAESNRGVRWAAPCILAIAAVKGFLLMDNFMELRHAPWPWRIAMYGWLTMVATMATAGYWF